MNSYSLINYTEYLTNSTIFLEFDDLFVLDLYHRIYCIFN